MSRVIVMKAQNTKFLIETDDSVQIPARLLASEAPLPGVPANMQPVVDLQELEHNFADVKAVIVTCCCELYEALQQIPQPETVSVEFGIKLGGEAGFPMLTKASGEANFKVSIEWKPDSQSK